MAPASEAEMDLHTACIREDVGSSPTAGSCEWCGTDISEMLNPASRPRRFCSLSCSAQSQGACRAWAIAYCKECGKPFDARRKERPKFCSHSCSARFTNRARSKRTAPMPCTYCGKELINNAKFCSRQCQRNMEFQQRVQLVVTSGSMDGVCQTDANRKKVLLAIRGRRCELCDTVEWMGEPVPLVLDHIDGHHENNALINLRLVCGNCDMQLPTYKGKNKGNGRQWRRDLYAVQTAADDLGALGVSVG
jgi:predicted nucleic acid-binding Zn ribbon protein